MEDTPLWGFLIAAVIIIFGVWCLLRPAPDHIEDRNGSEDHSIACISEEDIVSLKYGSRGAITQKESHFSVAGLEISDGIRYSSKKFTGVYRLHTVTLFKGSDIFVQLSDLTINSGNFAFTVPTEW